jgi:hypothetical protein
LCIARQALGCIIQEQVTCCDENGQITIRQQLVEIGGNQCDCEALEAACNTPPCTPAPAPNLAPVDSNCIGVGAKIMMADGTYKNVENIKAGDILLSVDMGVDPDEVDITNIELSLPSVSNWRYTTTVVKSVKFGFEKDYYLLNNKLRLTYEHPIAVKHLDRIFFRSASVLRGDEIMYNEKLEEVGYVVSKIDRALATMKINTESQDWFFADGILIHNAEVDAGIGMVANDPGAFGGAVVVGSSSSSKIIVS